MKFINNFLLKKANYNIKLLINNKKNEKCISNLKNQLDNIKILTNNDLLLINNKIDKIFISHSIKEALLLLNSKNIQILKYQYKYYTNYEDNAKLLFLFKEIEQDLKYYYKNRNIYNILPFHYNIYLNKK